MELNDLLYMVALLVYVLVPPSFLYWLFVHPLIGLWRRLGKITAYSILWGLILLMVVVLFQLRFRALSLHGPVSFGHALAGGLTLLIALYFRMRIHRVLPIKGLIGEAEIQGNAQPDTLVIDGVYSLIRHPRYVQMFIALLGYALLTNYLVIYLIWLLYIPLILLVIFLEERELLKRYGDMYRQYRSQVPMFIPHMSKWIN